MSAEPTPVARTEARAAADERLGGAVVIAVSRDVAHHFSKESVGEIRLIEGLGVEGDAHLGSTVQHLSRVRRDPTQPNLRQVHLIHSELLDDVGDAGFEVSPGQLGENVTTRGVDLLALGRGTVLEIGADAAVEVTGLRNPCTQIDGFEEGLLAMLVGRDESGRVVRRGGVMSVVRRPGVIRPGDTIRIVAPAGPHLDLEPV
ncbi:MAG: hypothetical protein RI885_542 [Actinomycetota bacterium]|jgi:MOSC domain-containing protein YiiM